MIAATLFSGIGAPENAMPHWDWRWCAEIERFASAVLQERHPHTVNLGDVSADDFAERAAQIARPDVLVFGSPCQSFSVAGQRLGLDDPRGNLALVALGIVARLKPRWFVFENVPGLLSSDEGRDFGIFLRAVDELRYCCSWTVLDAQYFGVAQRRERLFVVGSAGDWRGPAAVLFEPEGVRGHHPPSRTKGQGTTYPVAPSLTNSDRGVERSGESRGQDPLVAVPDIAWALQERDHKGTDSDTKDGHLIVQDGHLIVQAYDITGTGPNMVSGGSKTDVHTALRSRTPGHSEGSTTTVVTHALTSEGFDASEDGTGRGPPLVVTPILEAGARTGKSTDDIRAGMGVGDPGDPMFTLQADKQHAVALRGREGGATAEVSDVSNVHPVSATSAVRRLTPRECERLQGFPDGYTQVVYRGKSAMDGPRYRALGNSMAVPVVRWILERIERVDGGRAWEETS